MCSSQRVASLSEKFEFFLLETHCAVTNLSSTKKKGIKVVLPNASQQGAHHHSYKVSSIQLQ